MAKSALAEKSPRPLLLLLVEDNASDAFLIDGMLDTNRYEVCHVKTQSEAILALKEQSFDVCLLDLTLPDTSGFSALVNIQEKAPDMPILILTGVSDGALATRAVGRGAQDYLLKDELEAVTLARSIDYARERKTTEKELFRRANYDALTGLANRSLFESRLAMALARTKRMGSGLAVLYMDLDRFKPINDSYGHEAGDYVLKAVADCIQSNLRAYDTAARMGGDEFCVLLENIATPRNAAAIAHKIISALTANALIYHSKKLNIGVSIGIAFCDGDEQAEILLRNADHAMYRAKETGGSSYHFYAVDAQQSTTFRLKAEEEMLAALSKRQLRLLYQPYVASQGGALLGVEALLRWEHPERGLLNTSEFLAVAEECRLMPEISKWMFSCLLGTILTWKEYDFPSMEIAFNVSASQLDAPDFADCMAPLLAGEVIGPHRIIAEIDSGALTSLSPTRFFTLIKLREMGVILHLDHFGQAPVSLQTLHTYPFSLLKMDLFSIKRMNMGAQEDVMMGISIGLAHQLGMRACAVGVETAGQIEMLKSQRCDSMQGFLIGYPMTAEQLRGWVAAPVS